MSVQHRIRLADAAGTESLGAWIGNMLQKGDFVGLSGDLGAGKTTLARGLIQSRQRAHTGQADHVQSPTFTLVQPYAAGPLEIWHYDLYRIESDTELQELAIEEALDNGCAVCEWPDRLGGRLPPDRLDVELSVDGGGREAVLTAHGDFADRLAGCGQIDLQKIQVTES